MNILKTTSREELKKWKAELAEMVAAGKAWSVKVTKTGAEWTVTWADGM